MFGLFKFVFGQGGCHTPDAYGQSGNTPGRPDAHPAGTPSRLESAREFSGPIDGDNIRVVHINSNKGDWTGLRKF